MFWSEWVLIGLGGVTALLAIVAFVCKESVPDWQVKGKRVIITGGSSGIGLATAELLARQGAAAITIIARDQKRIDEAVPLIKKANDACSVYSISADVSKQAPVQEACEKAVQLMGGLDSVICSAGASLPCLFIATPESEFERLMQINYTGIVYVTKTCVPHLIRAGKGGRIVLVSSMAGLSGVAGFTAYSASKFALRGFAESLHMELSGPYGIAVSVVNPPDVDTPMLHRENEIKPLECRQISEGSGLFTAANIAGDIVDAMKSWKFLVNTGMDGKLLAFIASGTSPAHSGLVGTLELLSLGALRVVSLAYRWSYNRIVSHVHQQRVDGKLKDVGAEVHRKIVSEQAGGSSYGALAGGESKSRSNSLSNGKRK